MELRKVLRIIFTFLMLLILFIIILSIDLNKLIFTFSLAKLEFIPLILLVNLIAILFFVLAWHVILINLTKISFKESFISTVISIFANIIFPSASISGEIIRINYLKNKHNISYDKLLATTAFNRFQYAITMVLFLSIGVLLMYFQGVSFLPLLFSLIFVFISSFLLLLFILKTEFLKIIGRKLIYFLYKKIKKPKNPENIFNKFSIFIDKFTLDVLKIKTSYTFILAFIIMSLQWFFNSLAIYFAFLAFNTNVNFGIIIFTFPIFAMLTITPIGIPANIGLVESAMIGLYSSFGINIVTAAAATFLTRSLVIAEDLIIGWIFTIKEKKYII